MRNLVIGMAMASTMLATPALARDNSFYVQVEGGVMLVEDLDFDINGIEDDLTPILRPATTSAVSSATTSALSVSKPKPATAKRKLKISPWAA